MDYATFEYCGLCKCKIHDWMTHVRSTEHKRNGLSARKEVK